MGGRGAASDTGKRPYGSEFRLLFKASNIKFVQQITANNAKDPLETKTRGRVYATINEKSEINSISYYDANGKRYKTINLLHSHEDIKGQHTHEGYYHDENGTRHLTEDEKKLVAYVRKLWYNRHSK